MSKARSIENFEFLDFFRSNFFWDFRIIWDCGALSKLAGVCKLSKSVKNTWKLQNLHLAHLLYTIFGIFWWDIDIHCRYIGIFKIMIKYRRFLWEYWYWQNINKNFLKISILKMYLLNYWYQQNVILIRIWHIEPEPDPLSTI